MFSLLNLITAGQHYVFIVKGILYETFSLNCLIRAILTVRSKKITHVCPLCSLMSRGNNSVFTAVAHCFDCCPNWSKWLQSCRCVTLVLSITPSSASPIYTQAANIPAEVSISRIDMSLNLNYYRLNTLRYRILIWIHSEFRSPWPSPFSIETRDQHLPFLNPAADAWTISFLVH